MMNKKILGFIVAACMLFSVVYAYPASFIVEGLSAEVYGGAAYVITVGANNPSSEELKIALLDDDSNVIGELCVGTTDGLVEAFSMPIIMPAATDKSGKVTVYVDRIIPNDAYINDVKLSFASSDIVDCVQEEEVLTIQGNIGGTKNGELEVYVLADAEEYEISDSDKILLHETLEARKNSTFSLVVDTSDIEKYYTDMTVIVKGLKTFGYDFDATALDYTYIKTNLKDELVEKLSGAESADRIEEIFEGDDGEISNIELLGLSELEILTEFEDKDFLYNYLYENKNRISVEELADMVVESCMMAAVFEETITDEELAGYIGNYERVMGLLQEKYKPYSTVYKEMSDDDKEDVVSAMRKVAPKIISVEAFCRCLTDSAVKTKIRMAQNYTGVINVLKENEDYMNITIPSDLSVNAKKALANFAKDTDDLSKIEDEFEDIIEKADKQSDKNSGGGGGGGGSIGVVPHVKAPATSDTKVPQQTEKELFSDLKDAEWAVDYIKKMCEKGIINGYEDGSFRPNHGITRAEFVKMAVVAFDLYNKDAASNFADVPVDDWSYNYISSLFALGIVKGSEDGTFGKDEMISRQDMSVILFGILKEKAQQLQLGELDFEDAEEIAQYAQESVAAMKAAGIISGMGNGYFMPLENATRAQAAKVVCAAMGMIK